MTQNKRKSISRSLGEFFGHIIRGAKMKVDVDAEGNEVTREEVSRTVEEEDRGDDVTLRRTTIEEIEIRRKRSGSNDRAKPRE